MLRKASWMLSVRNCQEEGQTEKKQEDNNQLATIIKTYERFQLKILCKFKRVQLAKKSLKKSQEALIAGIDALTDNFDPVTGRRLFDAAGTLQWLTLTGGMQDIKQEHRRQIRESRLDLRSSPRRR